MTLHLARTSPPPAAALDPGDWIATRDGGRWRLEPHGAPPLPPGPLDHAGLARLVLAAARTVAW